MQTYIVKWGNSLGVRIPASFAKEIGITEGATIELMVRKDQIILKKKEYDLKTLLTQINSENLHKEINTESPIGKEVW